MTARTHRPHPQNARLRLQRHPAPTGAPTSHERQPSPPRRSPSHSPHISTKSLRLSTTSSRSSDRRCASDHSEPTPIDSDRDGTDAPGRAVRGRSAADVSGGHCRRDWTCGGGEEGLSASGRCGAGGWVSGRRSRYISTSDGTISWTEDHSDVLD